MFNLSKNYNNLKSYLRVYIQLTRMDKPIGTLLLLWPTLTALWIASEGVLSWGVLIVFILGVFLTRGAGCAINDYFDVDIDRHVARTKNRVLVSAKLAHKSALILALALLAVAFILAVLFLHVATVLLAILAGLLVVTYPLMKRFFALPQAYLGVAFSFGILMAFMEVQDFLNLISFMLFFANLFWVFGYDTIYAMVDLDDDLKLGIHTSAITFRGRVTQFVAFFYAMYVILLLSVGIVLHFSIIYYFGLLLAMLLLCYQVYVLYTRNKTKYFKMFLINNWVGFIIFVAIVFNYVYLQMATFS